MSPDRDEPAIIISRQHRHDDDDNGPIWTLLVIACGARRRRRLHRRRRVGGSRRQAWGLRAPGASRTSTGVAGEWPPIGSGGARLAGAAASDIIVA